MNIINLWWTCSIYGEHAQFIVNILILGWTYSIYSEHAQFRVNMLNLGWPCLIWYYDWIGLEKLPQKDSLNVQIHPQDQKIQWYLYWSQLIYTFTADLIKLLDWLWKTTPKWPFECPILSTGSKDTVTFILKSADLYSRSWFDQTIGLALKNYPKMTLWMSKSVHWFKRYSDIYIEVSWFVQSQLIWSNY